MMAEFRYGDPTIAKYTPASALAAGEVVVVGDRPYVSHADVATGTLAGLAAGGGVYELTADGAMSAGAEVYWDAAAEKLTLTSAGNKHFGSLTPGSSASADGDKVLALHNPQVKQAALAVPVGGATIVVGSESSDAVNVAIQLVDSDGADLTARGSVLAYLSDDANGDSVAATAPDGGWAIGTDGVLTPVVADKVAQLVSEADGDIDVTITESGADTFYLIVVLPDGTLVASDPITFVA